MTTKQKQAIERHGLNLLSLFPNAQKQDPMALCRSLRRLEIKGARFALQLCNGPEISEGEQDRFTADLLGKVNTLLGNTGDHPIPVFFNRDPRGYALKIEEDWLQQRRREGRTVGHKGCCLVMDWGGYGILAPEINEA